MIAKLLRRVAEHTKRPEAAPDETGLERDHPLLRFFAEGGATLANYLALDDVVVTAALERMQRASDRAIADLAIRLWQRRLYKTLDLRAFGHDKGRQRRAARRIDKELEEQSKREAVIKDEGAGVSIYTQIGGDDDRAHKKLHILDARGPREITEILPIVLALGQRKRFTRYYFENESDRESARAAR
jgi:hypothetical protein